MLKKEFGDNYKKVMGEYHWVDIECKIRENEEINQGGRYRGAASLSSKKRQN